MATSPQAALLACVSGCRAGRLECPLSRPPLSVPEFPTTALEMSAVASTLDTNGDGFIDYCEFVSALHPGRDMLRRTADAAQIQDEVGQGEREGTGCGSHFNRRDTSSARGCPCGVKPGSGCRLHSGPFPTVAGRLGEVGTGFP